MLKGDIDLGGEKSKKRKRGIQIEESGGFWGKSFASQFGKGGFC